VLGAPTASAAAVEVPAVPAVVCAGLGLLAFITLRLTVPGCPRVAVGAVSAEEGAAAIADLSVVLATRGVVPAARACSKVPQVSALPSNNTATAVSHDNALIITVTEADDPKFMLGNGTPGRAPTRAWSSLLLAATYPASGRPDALLPRSRALR
jgi:hypothetical protein